MEQTYSDTSAGDKIEVYEFLEALGLLDNEVAPVNMDDDDNNESDIDEEDSDDDQDNYWDPRKRYTRWDYKRRFGEDALKKLYQTQEARYQNIILTIKSLEDLLCITEGKPRNIKIGYAQVRLLLKFVFLEC